MRSRFYRARRCAVCSEIRQAINNYCEPLERRMMLSTITWSNRGSAVLDTDGFNAAFGANSATARSIVDRAIDDWERVITNFNGFLGRNTFTVSISAADLGPGTRGSTGSMVYDALLKPQSAAITIDDNGGGTGWYFDTVPGTALVPDDSEFNVGSTPFQGDSALAGFDLYRTAAHELGHAMGLSSSSTLLTAIDIDIGDDPLDGGSARLFTIDVDGVAGVDYTYTNAGGFHLFEGTAPGATSHPNDLMNSGRTAITGRRQLISDTIASLLRDAYSYTVTLPSLINTFYVNLNTTTNVVTIIGDINPNGSDIDVIDLEVTGTAGRFEVNGTSEIIEGAEFSSIVVNAGAAADDIDVDQLLGGKSVTVNGGAGNDNISAAQQLQDIDTNLGSNFTANGDGGTDTLVFNDQSDGAGGDDYTLTTTTFTKNASVINRVITYGTFEAIVINGSAQPSTYDINSLSSSLTTGLTINAGAANDTITIGGTLGDIDSLVNANIIVNGNGGTDALIFNDVTDDASVNDSYTLTSTSFAKSSTTESYTFATVENVTLTAGLANNTININSFSNIGTGLLSLVVNANDGNDQINIGNGDLDSNLAFTAITLNGQAGTDAVYFNDLTDTGSDNYTLTTTSLDKDTAGVEPPIAYATIESVVLDCNAEANTINITSNSIPTTVNGNGGNDTFQLGNVGGDAEALNGALTINGNAGTDAWLYQDSTNGFSDTYTLTSTTVTRTANGIVTFDTIENTTLNAGSGSNTINVPTFSNIGTGLLSLTINANSGTDAINLGSGDMENDLTFVAVTVDGGAGADSLYLNDLTDAEGSDSYTITATTFDKNTAGLNLITYATLESILLDANPFNNTININGTATGTPVTVNGNNGSDTFNIAAGDWDSNFGADVTVNGGTDASTDTCSINDTTDTVNDNYTVGSTSSSKSSTAVVINYSNFERWTLDANGFDNTITVNSAFDNCRINGNGGADFIDVLGNQVGTFLTVDGGAGLDRVRVNQDEAGTAAVQFANSQDLSSLELFAGSTVRVNDLVGDNSVVTDSMGLVRGTLDLNDNYIVVRGVAGSVPFYVDKLTRGYNAGGWNGVPAGGAAGVIRSATAAGSALGDGVGYGLVGAAAGQLNIASYRGTAVAAGDLIMSYTLYGDTDLNRTVDITDLASLATNWQLSPRNWVQGNFNYDLIVDITDLAALATNWQLAVPGPSFDQAMAQVFSATQRKLIARQLSIFNATREITLASNVEQVGLTMG